MNNDEQLVSFGRQIQQARTAKGLSLEQFAKEAGTSVGLLSQLERGIGNPSFITIAKIAYALGVPISAFFDNEATIDVVVRPDRRKKLFAPGLVEKGMVYELLTPDLNRALEAIWVELPPGESNKEQPFQHQGEEFGLLLEGTLEVHVGTDVHVLEAGDSVSYRSSVPHWYRNPGNVPAKSVWVITPPSF